MRPSIRIGIGAALGVFLFGIFFQVQAQGTFALGSLSTPLTGITGVVYPDDIYIFGGVDAAGNYQSTTQHQFHCNGCSWSPRAAMPTARAFGTAVKVITGSLAGWTVVIGGRNNSGPLNTVEAYNPTTDTWGTLPSMTYPRSNMKAINLNGNIHVFGGLFTGSNVWAEHEIFNTSTFTWSVGPSMPMALMDFGLARLTEFGTDYAYIFGGRQHPTNPNSIVANNYRYDPVLGTYSPRAPMPIARASFGSASDNYSEFALYAYGGYTNPLGTMTDSIHKYMIWSNTWTPHAVTLAAPAAEFWGEGFWDAATNCAFQLLAIGGRDSTGTIVADSRTYYVQSGPFAVANAGFSGLSSENKIDLKWTMVTPLDVSHFELRHSLDGNHFELLGENIQAGNAMEWTFAHDTKEPGVHFYTLQTFDSEGLLKMSLQTQVLMQANSNGGFRMFPNPNSGQLNLAFQENESKKLVALFDVAGKLVFEKTFEAGAVDALDLSGLNAGIYMVRVKAGNTVQQQKLILQ